MARRCRPGDESAVTACRCARDHPEVEVDPDQREQAWHFRRGGFQPLVRIGRSPASLRAGDHFDSTTSRARVRVHDASEYMRRLYDRVREKRIDVDEIVIRRNSLDDLVLVLAWRAKVTGRVVGIVLPTGIEVRQTLRADQIHLLSSRYGRHARSYIPLYERGSPTALL